MQLGIQLACLQLAMLVVADPAPHWHRNDPAPPPIADTAPAVLAKELAEAKTTIEQDSLTQQKLLAQKLKAEQSAQSLIDDEAAERKEVADEKEEVEQEKASMLEMKKELAEEKETFSKLAFARGEDDLQLKDALKGEKLAQGSERKLAKLVHAARAVQNALVNGERRVESKAFAAVSELHNVTAHAAFLEKSASSWEKQGRASADGFVAAVQTSERMQSAVDTLRQQKTKEDKSKTGQIALLTDRLKRVSEHDKELEAQVTKINTQLAQQTHDLEQAQGSAEYSERKRKVAVDDEQKAVQSALKKAHEGTGSVFEAKVKKLEDENERAAGSIRHLTEELRIAQHPTVAPPKRQPVAKVVERVKAVPTHKGLPGRDVAQTASKNMHVSQKSKSKPAGKNQRVKSVPTHKGLRGRDLSLTSVYVNA